MIFIWPIIVVVGFMGLILLSTLVLESRLLRVFLPAIAILGLGGAGLTVHRIFPLLQADLQPEVAYVPPHILFNSISFDSVYLFICAFLCLFLIGVLILSVALWQKGAWEWPVFLCLLLGSLVGMVFLASTWHLIFFVVAFELASMPSYILVGFRRFHRKSAEGSAKYVVFGAVCSAIMLYGISLLYGLTGSLDFREISLRLFVHGLPVLGVVGLVCLLVGIAFKISLVPMHFWCPDAFEAAGADVAGWLSVASKAAALVVLARFAQVLMSFGGDGFNHTVAMVITVLAVVTMTLANLSAYWQTSVKRLLAYSSIAHAGYMVCAVVVLPDLAGLSAIVAYLVVYLLMNLGAFSVTGLVEQATGSDDIERFAGLGIRNPALAAVMTFFLFSLVGLPPLAGFAAKWILLSVLWQHQQTFLVVAILANTLFSLFYYMRIARAMYFDRPTRAPVKSPALALGVVSLCAAGLIILFIGWGLLNSFSIRLIPPSL
jgi:NADH-quinone oxidoreductase subunit N